MNLVRVYETVVPGSHEVGGGVGTWSSSKSRTRWESRKCTKARWSCAIFFAVGSSFQVYVISTALPRGTLERLKDMDGTMAFTSAGLRRLHAGRNATAAKTSAPPISQEGRNFMWLSSVRR